MSEVEKYISDKYLQTKWPFIYALEIINKFGEEGRMWLNEMASDGKIRKREGINGNLIEIINLK